MKHSNMEKEAFKSLWATSDPRLAEKAERWPPSSMLAIGESLIDLYTVVDVQLYRQSSVRPKQCT